MDTTRAIIRFLFLFDSQIAANHREISWQDAKPGVPGTRETGRGASVATSSCPTREFPPLRARDGGSLGGGRRMVGWKPLLRQADAHTVSPNVPSHLHLPTRPSKSLRLPPPFRSSASEQGTPRNRLHSAALPANQIAHPEILAAFLSRYSLLLD